eukprot:TRINITY_DN10490_c0_g3_i1.p2 TRINITY_DN10490_c0_g3~~TRINITY_DN10490_c0_g3_i1.p2  ORF type:complete len:200 (+),score=105.21 TRINITY_DN10490_c0_g3_i1:228-827(+)
MMYNGQCYTSFPAPPKGLPSMPPPRRKKMTEEEICQTSERLNYKKPRKISLQPLQPKKLLSADRLKEASHRMCNEELERRERTRAHIRDQMTKSDPLVKAINAEALQESVDRLYQLGQQQVKDLSKKLDDKYNPVSPSRKIGTDGIATYNDRFYASRKNTRRENAEKLKQKYVYDCDPPKKKLTKEQMEAAVSRLANKA